LRTGAGRYDRVLDQWVADHTLKTASKKTGAGKASGKLRMDGYGIIPDDILYYYANYDADVTRRLALIATDLLTADAFDHDNWNPFWISMRALMPILEINCTGITVSRERLEFLTEQYSQHADALLAEIREWAKWDTFNPNSAHHVRELLFGTKYNRKVLTKAQLEKPPTDVIFCSDGIQLRPKGARSLELTPILTTGKYPVKWDTIAGTENEAFHTPSVNKDVLSQLLFFQNKKVVKRGGKKYTLDYTSILEKLQHRTVLAQTLRYVLKPPQEDEDLQVILDANGDVLYDGGIPGSICDDGKVRTSLYPTAVTGRWRSSRPALQNVGNAIEGYLERILKDSYKYPIRNIFCAKPDHVLIEADYTGAELAAAAYMCNDPVMIEHCRRNQLSENDPNYYDIHSHIAVAAFRLGCDPTKAGLKSIGKTYLRIIAKSVIFGLFYGRSALAIAEEARSQGILISEADAQQIINQISVMYPKLLPYFRACEAQVMEKGWLVNAFGRYRRFPAALDESQAKRFGRQAKNFPIQSLVADVVNRAVDYFYTFRNQRELESEIVLQIHDAIIVEAPFHEARIIYEELLPKAMVKCVPILPVDLTGKRIPGTSECYLGIDRKMYDYWGTAIKDLTKFGITI
jgi:DNA polymerase I-like protein with 3'-5' exonuclease and polymerase domains